VPSHLRAHEPTTGRLAAPATSTGTVTSGYDPTTGNLVSLTSTTGEDLAYTYEGTLRTSATWSGPVAGTVATAYDAFLRPQQTSVNGTHAAARVYDADGLLTATGALSLTRHAAHGLVTASALGTVGDGRTYNSFGELDTYTATASGSPALEIAYQRDAVGRIIEKTETVLGGTPHTTAYGYDARGRLETVNTDGASTVTYVYDENGNRLARTTSGGGLETGTYDGQDRLLAYAGAVYTYTANGDLATKTVGGVTTAYHYDALGNLRSVERPDGTAIEYVIDPENRRVGKRVDGVLVQGFVYEDQLRVAAELDGAGNVVSRFMYGTRVNVPEYVVKGEVTYRLLCDHLGSPRLVINANTGAVVQRMEYDEFGRVLTDTAPGFQPFGFAGGLYDRDTGLVRFGARDYDPATGRWTAKEPVGFGGRSANLYGYTFNDPLNLIDADGRIPILIPVAGAVLGAGASIYSNWGAYQSGAISGADLASAAAFAAGTGALAAFPSGVFGSALAGAAAAFANDVFNQSLTACGSLNFGAAGKTGALGLLGGAVAGFGASAGSQVFG
jgi:RHS repeat-associated protein